MLEYLTIIVSGASALAALGATWASLRNANKIQEIHLSINSRMDQLINASRSVGAQEERDRPIKPSEPV